MSHWLQSITAKVIGVGFLTLLMLWPLAEVNGLVREREGLRAQATQQIARSWGGRQVLGGPVLVVPTREEEFRKDGAVWVDGAETLLADSLRIEAVLDTSTRHYGIYATPVYIADVTLDSAFSAEDLAQARAAATGVWQAGKAELRLPLSDTGGLQAVEALRINGRPARFASSSARVGGHNVVVVPLDLDTLGAAPIHVEARFRLAGTEAFGFLPLARSSAVKLRAPWPDPSFVGAALPQRQRVDAAGFEAEWQRLDLNRAFGQHWRSRDDQTVGQALDAAEFGVGLLQPVDVYQRNVRAGKYGLLVVALTFLVFFLFEMLGRRRVHPVQYLMVGAALATFYVVLLALSEQIGFDLAYLAAGATVSLIVGGYVAGAWGSRRAGLLLGAALALLYALLYGLIAAEQYALLAGASVLLGALALVMYLTRHIDWYPIEIVPVDPEREVPH